MPRMIALLLVLSLALVAMPATAKKPPKVVFSAEGTVYAPECTGCSVAEGVMYAFLQTGMPDLPDGLGVDVIEGAAENKAKAFRMHINVPTTRLPAELSVVFYGSNGAPIATYDTLGDEMGCVPKGTAYVAVHMDFGLEGQYEYTEFKKVKGMKC